LQYGQRLHANLPLPMACKLEQALFRLEVDRS
jgi:hypothetical protein